MLCNVELVVDDLALGAAGLAGLAQPRDDEGLKQRGEAAAGLGPGQPDAARAVPLTVAAGRLSVQDWAVLTGVEVAPAALGLVVVEGAIDAAFGAGPAGLLLMLEEDADLAGRPFELDLRNAPLFPGRCGPSAGPHLPTSRRNRYRV